MSAICQAYAIFNWFASGEHHYQYAKDGTKILRWGRVDHECVMAEVYQTLTDAYFPLNQALDWKRFMEGKKQEAAEQQRRLEELKAKIAAGRDDIEIDRG